MKFDEIVSVDKRREEGGWVTEGFRDFPGLKLRVRGDGCEAERKLRTAIWDGASVKEREADDFAENTAQRLASEAWLLDWNIEDRPCTPENAAEAVKMTSFLSAVIYATRVVGGLGRETLEADTKN